MIRYEGTLLPSVGYRCCWLNSFVALLLGLIVFVLPSPVFAESVVFEDGEFSDAQWESTTFAATEITGLFSEINYQMPFGGASGPYRQHRHSIVGSTVGRPIVTVSHNRNASVNPATLGGISRLDFWVAARPVEESNYTLNPVIGLALIQEGEDGVIRTFIAPAYIRAEVSQDDNFWDNKGGNNYGATEFFWLKGGNESSFLDRTAHPNFSSSGKPIGLGYFVQGKSHPAHRWGALGIDNWMVRVKPGAPLNHAPVITDAYVVSKRIAPSDRGPVGLIVMASDRDNGPQPLTYTWTQIEGPRGLLKYRGSAPDGTYERLDFYPPGNDFPVSCDTPLYQFTVGAFDGKAWDSRVLAIYADPAPPQCPDPESCPLSKLATATISSTGLAATTSWRALDDDFLSVYRNLRDRGLAPTPEGQRYIQLFESHTPEIVSLLTSNNTLVTAMSSALLEIKPVFQAMLANSDSSASLTAQQAHSLNSMIDTLATAASPELQGAIAAERTRWGPLENYIGRSATEIQQALLGYGVYLPRVTSPSTLVLTNATANQARATIDWTDSTGKIIASAEKILSPQGVTVVPVPSADFNGAARILSDRLVRAFVINRSTNGSVLGTDEGAVPGKRVTLPLFRQPGATGAGTTLTVYNIDATSAADVTLGHRDEKGSDRGTKTVTIPPLGLYTFDAKAINGKAKGASAAVISSTRPVVASQQSTSKGSRAMLPAVAESRECTSCSLGLVPFGPSKGAGQRADIYVHNRGTAESTVTLTYLDPKGNKRATQQVKIPALGLARFDTSKAVRRGRALTGYVQVTQSGGPQRLAVQWAVRNQKDGTPIGFNAVGTTSGAPTWACVDSQREKNERQRPLTKLAILNPTGTADQATVELYDAESGQRLATQTVQLPASGLVELSLTTKAYRQASVGFAVVRSASGAGLIINAHSGAGGGASRSSCQPLV